MFDLISLGWNSYFQQQYNDVTNGVALVPGRIAVENKHRYVVLCEYGELNAEVSGKLLFMSESVSELPKVGDWVLMSVFPDENKGIIHHCLDRKTRFSRKQAGMKFEEQIIAANIDILFIVQGLDNNYNLRRLERYLVMAKNGNIEPVIILSKADLCNSIEVKVREVEQIAGGNRILTVSAYSGQGIDQLESIVSKNLTCAFVGSSGTGKSTLINTLAGEHLQHTSETREKDSRGRHTTTKRELIILSNGGILIDTPGMREFYLWAVDDSLEETFNEIEIISQNCMFSDCRHLVEKGCAVLEALDNGTISRERYNSYVKLSKEREFLESKTDLDAFLKRKKRDKDRQKMIKQILKNINRK
ncbi:MAG: ribosome small subunit-dependent GTPase A [Ignavibacteriales bacterium]